MKLYDIMPKVIIEINPDQDLFFKRKMLDYRAKTKAKAIERYLLENMPLSY